MSPENLGKLAQRENEGRFKSNHRKEDTGRGRGVE